MLLYKPKLKVDIGTVIKMLLGKPNPTLECLGSSPRSRPIPHFLLMLTLGTS